MTLYGTYNKGPYSSNGIRKEYSPYNVQSSIRFLYALGATYGYLNAIISTRYFYRNSQFLGKELEEMMREIEAINGRLNELDSKYDKKFEAVTKELSDLKAKITEVSVDIGWIKDAIKEIKERTLWWKTYLLAPVISGIVIAVLLRLFGIR